LLHRPSAPSSTAAQLRMRDTQSAISSASTSRSDAPKEAAVCERLHCRWVWDGMGWNGMGDDDRASAPCDCCPSSPWLETVRRPRRAGIQVCDSNLPSSSSPMAVRRLPHHHPRHKTPVVAGVGLWLGCYPVRARSRLCFHRNAP
jgi:hypothetical protein